MSAALSCVYYEALGTNPYENLAFEKVLMESRKDREAFLYLWQNDHSIIIGRNQDAFAECRVERFLASGGKIVRRLTGGGAVYHDLGNLNYTMVFPPDYFDIPKQMAVICRALELVGLPGCKWNGRNDLMLEGRKCSGNAFQLTRQSACHHGTLLLTADLSKISLYLTAKRSKLMKHGIQSVEARVMNICDKLPALTIDTMKAALRQAFGETYGSLSFRELSSLQQKKIMTEMDFLQGREWLYPESPQNPEILEGHFPWGEICIALQVLNGCIVSASFHTDALEGDWFASLAERIKNVPRNEADLFFQKLKEESENGNADRRQILTDLEHLAACRVISKEDAPRV